MNYSNGLRIRIGDCVWWDGGTAIGYVDCIIDAPDVNTVKSSEMQDSGVMLLLTQGRSPLSPRVFYSNDTINSEDVVPLNDKEMDELRAIKMLVYALSSNCNPDYVGIYCVVSNYLIESWRAVDYSADPIRLFSIDLNANSISEIDNTQLSMLYYPSKSSV